MNKWIVILVSIIIVLVLSIMTVKTICHSIETSVIYKNPVVKYNRTVRENRTVVLSSKTDIHFSRADRFTLMPDGLLIVDNPTQFQTTQTTNSTTVANTTTVESGVSKPDLSILKQSDWLVGLEYVHINGDKDLQKIFVAKRIVLDLYIGMVYTTGLTSLHKTTH